MRIIPRITFLRISFLILLAIILVYTFGYFSQAPYPGFLISENGKTVLQVFDDEQADKFQPDDELISINAIQISDYNNSLTLQYWENVSPGDPVPITVLRDGKELDITWFFTGKTQAEYRNRIFCHIWIAFIFWTCGVSAYLTIRPTDDNWRLYLTYCFLFSIWFVTSSGPTGFHLLYSSHLERISAWLLIPTIAYLHWRFPRYLAEEFTRKYGNGFLIFSYLISIGMLVFDLLNPDKFLYTYGFLATLILAIIFSLIRYAMYKETRDPLRAFFLSTLIGYSLPSALLVLRIFGEPVTPAIQIVGSIVLIFIPIAFLYIIWNQKIPKYQFRPSRYLALLFYSIIVIIVIGILLLILENIQQPLNTTISILIAVSIATITTQAYPLFVKIIDQKIFRMPVSSADLLQSLSQQLDSTKDTASISSLMGDIILPGLMVRQSALLEFQTPFQIRVLDHRGVNRSQIPSLVQINQLLDLEIPVIPPQTIKKYPRAIHWIRVIIPLIFDENVIGIWLLGQRDPSDVYEKYEIDLLRALAQQTTIALIHTRKSKRLRNLYKANIDRDEEERARLARNLHDDTLNDLALLQRKTNDPILSEGITKVIGSLRKAINGLRPELLSYGLATALYDLADGFNDRQSRTAVIVQLEGEPIPVAPKVEQHLYRIVQQACENSLRHSEASLTRIIGIITPKAIHLTVIDNGIGFDVDSTLDFSELIANQHYGLAGMHERADLINATLTIQSNSEHGTRISIYWKNPQY
jgi:signal transduction histidine kinase